MLTLPAAAQIHLGRTVTKLAVAGVIFKRDGTTVRCTQHDEDIEIEDGDNAGIYRSVSAITSSDVKSSSDLSVDNMEVEGIISDDFIVTGFNVADIEAGLFKGAPFQTFLCQYDAPNDWQKLIRRGYLGDISRTAEGRFTCEWRGIVQKMQQMCGRTYGELCDVDRFGDARCKIDATAKTISGVVTSVTSRRRFDSTVGAPPSYAQYDLGDLTFTSGANSGYMRQVKQAAAVDTLGQFELWDSFPYAIQVGDEFTVRPDCDRRYESCALYNNYKNFRGHGRWIPGIANIIRAP